SRGTRSRRAPRPGARCRRRTRARARCGTSAAARRAMKSTDLENRGFFRRPPSPVSKQAGFTIIGILIIVAVMGAGLAATGTLFSHAAQREKERELLFAGNQIRQAIASYYRRSPGVSVYPKK